MAKLILLLCAAFLSRASGYVCKNDNEKANLNNDLSIMAKIITELKKADNFVLSTMPRGKEYLESIMTKHIQEEAAILKEKVEMFRNKQDSNAINVQSTYCKRFSTNYLKNEEDAFRKHYKCLNDSLTNRMNEIRSTSEEISPFFWKMYETDKKLKYCLSLNEKRYSLQAAGCGKELHEVVAKAYKEYLRKIDEDYVVRSSKLQTLLNSNIFEWCMNNYGNHKAFVEKAFNNCISMIDPAYIRR